MSVQLQKEGLQEAKLPGETKSGNSSVQLHQVGGVWIQILIGRAREIAQW